MSVTAIKKSICLDKRHTCVTLGKNCCKKLDCCALLCKTQVALQQLIAFLTVPLTLETITVVTSAISAINDLYPCTVRNIVISTKLLLLRNLLAFFVSAIIDGNALTQAQQQEAIDQINALLLILVPFGQDCDSCSDDFSSSSSCTSRYN